MRRSKAFVFAFTAITFSWVPGHIVTGHHLLGTLIIVIALFGGLALMVAAVSGGFREERETTSLNLSEIPDEMSRKQDNLRKLIDFYENPLELPSLRLAQYLDLVRPLPPTTRQQKENFADFASHAHSWYKHLPLYPPGVPFYFFIDKYAGCDFVLKDDGTGKIVERDERGFHYSAIPTKEYRTRFGHLAFSCGAGTTVLSLGGGPIVMPRHKTAAVLGDDAKLYGLPPEILNAGEVPLTAVIHTFGQSFSWWDTRIRKDRDRVEWPQESGGQAILEKIFARCRGLRDLGFDRRSQYVDSKYGMVDPVLHYLLAPEQKRQQNEMVKAMDRVCDLIAGRV